MSIKRSIWACHLLLGTAACAIHPLPEDVTRDNTVQIVRKIRCETRFAVQSQLVQLLGESSDLGLAIRSGDLSVSRVTSMYDADRSIVPDAEARKLIDRYRKTAIAFGFRFNILEQNNESISAGFGEALTNGLISVSLKVGDEKERKAERKFTIADTFEGLFTDLDDSECAALAEIGPHLIYPITGRIGMHEVVETFVDLDEEADFSVKDGSFTSFTDTITFQTKIFGSLEPSVQITRDAGEFGINDAGGKIEANRIDVHEVTVSIVPPSDAATPARDVAAVQATPQQRAIQNVEEERRDRQIARDLREVVREER
jgi:hypothetical protein